MAGQRRFAGGPLDLYCWGNWLWAIMREVTAGKGRTVAAPAQDPATKLTCASN